jgi:hypothetical protein
MSTEPQPEPAGTRMPDEGAQQQPACPTDQPDAYIDTSPGDQRAAAPWTQATDDTGALKATRDMPEPDSLGG